MKRFHTQISVDTSRAVQYVDALRESMEAFGISKEKFGPGEWPEFFSAVMGEVRHLVTFNGVPLSKLRRRAQ